MRRWLLFGFAFAATAGLCVLGHSQQVLDIGKSLRPSFSEIALLPTRLTYYNMHQDAALASYTCCRPDQEEEIRKALAANAIFLENYYDTDFAASTLIHNTWVNSVRRNFRHQVAALEQLVIEFPNSHLADDALHNLAKCYIFDKDHEAAIVALETLVVRWPDSVWADDALMNLASQLRAVDDHDGALATLDQLATHYPSSDHTPAAIHALAARAMEDEDYEETIRLSDHLLDYYNCSEYADDAQFRIAESLRHMGDWQAALDAYVDLIERLPGSTLTNRAMREVNSIIRQAARVGRSSHELYDTEAYNPGRDAEELYNLARHHQNYREYAQAIDLYFEFADTYPGHDKYDQALYNIGICYQQTNILFQDINKAKGPEDILKFRDEYQDATGAYGALPKPGELSAIEDAVTAFAIVVNDLVGSPLRDDALYQIAKSYEDSEMPEDMAFTYMELLVHFPNSDHHFESLYEVTKFIADDNNWELAQAMYADLAQVYPDVFPYWLLNARLDFQTVMRAYAHRLHFAWFESHRHHIPYHFAIPDLRFDSVFYEGALALSAGQYNDAVALLTALAHMPTNDLCVPSKWLVARAYELAGKTETAAAWYNDIIAVNPRSGLADDATLALENLGREEPGLAEYRREAEQVSGYSLENFDWHVGDKVVVFAPFTVSAKMRMYNMPNIWENAQSILCEWAEVARNAPAVVFVDPVDSQTEGKLIRLPASQIKDPPRWSLGLAQLARPVIAQAVGGRIGQRDGWIVEGLARFAAASLQYDLVTETRDAIGSAAAVKLPQEEVLKARDRALARLAEYVRANQGPERLNADILCGMLFHLLDVQGFSQYRLIDREPYRPLFANLQKQSGSGVGALAAAMNECFDGEVSHQLEQWRLPLRERVASQGN